MSGEEKPMRDFPDLKLGDRVAVAKDGVIYTDTVQAVSYSSPEPTIYRDMTWRERLLRHRHLRRVVPARFRQPIKPVRDGKPSTITVQVGADTSEMREAMHRHQKNLEQIQQMFGGFTGH